MPKAQNRPLHYRFKPMLTLGARYARLTAIEFAGWDRKNQKWRMQCDCGAITVAYAFGVKSGRIQSCGCLQREAAAAHFRTHGMAGTSTYKSWEGMIQRCTNPKATKFYLYGGRGVSVCERWRSFENFYEDMGAKPSLRHSIDRYPDRDGNYEKDNCRWATAKEQAWSYRRVS